MLKKIKQRLLLSIAIGGLIYLAFTVYADYTKIIDAFSRFNLRLIPLLLLIISINYLIRFLKWEYYLRELKIQVKRIDSFAIFMSGLVMSITPGKFGELIKSYLLKQVNGTPISKSSPVILGERLTDFIALIVIAMAGAYWYDYGRVVILAMALFFVAVIIIVSWRRASLYLVGKLSTFSFTAKYSGKLMTMYESSYQLLRPRPLTAMSIVSIFSWSMECLAYYIILINFKITVSVVWAFFAFAFGIVLGAVSMLPGGLGVTEGSLTYLVVEQSYPLDSAIASTFFIRVVTLWFAVLMGIIAVSLYQKRFGEISISSTTIQKGEPHERIQEDQDSENRTEDNL